MISAKEARQTSEAVQDKYADMLVLDVLIQSAAMKGDTWIRVPYEMVNVKGYSAVFKADGLADELHDLGYTLESMYEELQFVDIWMKVSW